IFTVATEVDGQRGYASLSEFYGDPEHVLLRRAIRRDEDRGAARRFRRKKIGRDVMTVRSSQRCDALQVHTTLSIIPEWKIVPDCGNITVRNRMFDRGSRGYGVQPAQ